MPQFDFLIIGSGVAGLTFSIKVAERFPEAKVAIVTKDKESESNTRYAQGGIAVVLDELKDSFEQHIEDTLKAGDGLCNEEVVNLVVKEGPDRLDELINWGTSFDEKSKGKFDLGLEGGHTFHRILHHKDITGKEIESKLLQHVHNLSNIKILSHHFAIDLITQHHLQNAQKISNDAIQCYGAYVLDKKTGKIEPYLSKVTLLATGGAGQVYKNTTNPSIATGDGIAMAYRAKAYVEGIEFVQFHPTALYRPGHSGSSFLISEAVRGFGAHLKNEKGQRFMQNEKWGELASRDIVSRAIDKEMKRSGAECVFLDCRHLDMKAFQKHFPNIYKKCKEIGIHPAKEMIPVVPSAHYFCGGVKTNTNGMTTVKNLYACGECAHTGLHGANRLASNSLLEAVVFAHRCFLHASEHFKTVDIPDGVPEWEEEGTSQPDELILITHNWRELQALMSDYVGIVRSDERLNRALRRLEVMHEENEQLYKRTRISPQLSELRNLISVAYLIVQHSLKRKENAGAFFKQ